MIYLRKLAHEFAKTERDFDPATNTNLATNYLGAGEITAMQYPELDKGQKFLHFKTRLDSSILTSDAIISDLFNIQFKQHNSHARNKDMIRALEQFDKQMDNAQNNNFADMSININNFAYDDNKSSDGFDSGLGHHSGDSDPRTPGNRLSSAYDNTNTTHADKYPYLNRIGILTDRSIVGFFPIIANQLLFLLNSAVIDDTIILISKVLVRLVHRINNILKMPNITECFVEKIFKINTFSEQQQSDFHSNAQPGDIFQSQHYSHDSILRALVLSLDMRLKINDKEVYSGDIAELVLINLGWFLNLIFKSMVQLLFFKNKNSISRKGRFNNEFKENLEKLVTFVIYQLQYCKKNRRVVNNAIIDIARFMSRSLCVMDRGFIFGLIQKLLKELEKTYFSDIKMVNEKSVAVASNDHSLSHQSEDHDVSRENKVEKEREARNHPNLRSQRNIKQFSNYARYTTPGSNDIINLKLDIIKILCEHQNFTQLNLPSLDDLRLKLSLDEDYMKQHFLLGLLLFHLQTSLVNDQMKERIVSIFRDVVLKHEIDDRYSGICKFRIFSLYLPFLNIMSKYLNDMNNKNRLSDKPDKTMANLCLTWTTILNNSQPGILQKYWSSLTNAEIVKFIKVLKFIVDLFKYQSGQCFEGSNSIKEQNIDSSYISSQTSHYMYKSIISTLLQLIKLSQSKVSSETTFKEILEVLVNILKNRPSNLNYISSLNFIRVFSNKFGKSLLTFKHSKTALIDLVQEILNLFSISFKEVREEAAITYFTLLKNNFEHMHRQNINTFFTHSIISFHKMMGQKKSLTDSGPKTKNFKNTIALLVAIVNQLKPGSSNCSYTNHELTKFKQQILDLLSRLDKITTRTAELPRLEYNNELLIENYYDIATSYDTSKDIKYTWLKSIEDRHIGWGNYVEAAIAGIQALKIKLQIYFETENLGEIYFKDYLKIFQSCLENISSTVRLQMNENLWTTMKKVSPSDKPGDSLNAVETTDPNSKQTYDEILELIHHPKFGVINLLISAKRYESVLDLYKIITPIVEFQKDIPNLSTIFTKQSQVCKKWENDQNKRYFGSYFRVRYFGKGYSDDENLYGEEYVYKEPDITSLADFKSKLETQFHNSHQTANSSLEFETSSKEITDKMLLNISDPLDMSRDSGNINKTKSYDIKKKTYIQISYLVPLLDDTSDLEINTSIPSDDSSKTNFARHTNINKFIFEYQTNSEGHKIKTIIKCQDNFPNIKTRIPTSRPHKSISLSPIMAAIEEMDKKSRQFEKAILESKNSGNLTLLEMHVNGSVAANVNGGPVSKYAVIFFGSQKLNSNHASIPDLKSINKLKTSFRRFTKLCYLGVKKFGDLANAEKIKTVEYFEECLDSMIEDLSGLMKEDLRQSAINVESVRKGNEGDSVYI